MNGEGTNGEESKINRVQELMRSMEKIPGRIKSSFSSDNVCRHEKLDSPVRYEEERIWELVDSYLNGDVYWTATDAAFGKTRERVKEYKCLGCGEETTIKTGEVLERVWKEDMRKEAIAHMRDIATTGSWYNGRMWWEDNIWEGDAKDVATRHDWMLHIGYTDWKKGGFK